MSEIILVHSTIHSRLHDIWRLLAKNIIESRCQQRHDVITVEFSMFLKCENYFVEVISTHSKSIISTPQRLKNNITTNKEMLQGIPFYFLVRVYVWALRQYNMMLEFQLLKRSPLCSLNFSPFYAFCVSIFGQSCDVTGILRWVGMHFFGFLHFASGPLKKCR